MHGHNTAGTQTSGRHLIPGDHLILAAGVALLAAFMLLDPAVGSRLPPAFADMSVEQKKQEFFAYLRPMVADINREMAMDRDRVRAIRRDYEQGTDPGWIDRRFLRQLAQRLDVSPDSEDPGAELAILERRSGVVPESLVLVQAAMESGWGTSRFALEGNNYFGQRCYEPDCGMQPNATPTDADFGVARFGSVRESVESYMLNLNTHPEYREFRDLRLALRNNGDAVTGLALVHGLSSYSERGEEYVAEIAAMIRANGLE